jgi:hypothetical protein
VQQGALAGAVPADQSDARPVLDGEVDAVERADVDAMACVVLMRPVGSLRTRPPVTSDMARRFSERLRVS